MLLWSDRYICDPFLLLRCMNSVSFSGVDLILTLIVLFSFERNLSTAWLISWLSNDNGAYGTTGSAAGYS